MTTSTELNRLMAEDTAQREAAVARVAERGGLPTLSGVEALEQQLTAVHETLERWTMDAEAVMAAHGEVEVPFHVTAENVAALGLVVAHIEHDLREFRSLSDRIGEALLPVDYVRREQAEAA